MAKLAIYHPWIYLKGGAEKVLLEYSQNTQHNTKLYTSYLGKETFSELLPITTVASDCLAKVNVKRTMSKSFVSLLAILTTRLALKNTDALLISSEGFGDFVGLFRIMRAKKTIAFVHTPLKIVYDPATVASTKARLNPFSFFIFARLLKPIYKLSNRLVWRRFDLIVANSIETKRRIVEGKLASSQNIMVVHPGTTQIQKQKRAPISSKFTRKQFLIAGRIMIQKNIEAGIEAFLQAKIDSAKLVITGHCDAKSQSYLRMLQTKYQHENITFVPNPNDKQYSDLFAQSFCLIFTPLNEDWGIIPIEAMAYAMPVIAFNSGGPAESILHNKTGLLCDININDLKNGIQQFSSIDEQHYEEYCQQALNRATQFTWTAFSSKLDKMITKVCQ